MSVTAAEGRIAACAATGEWADFRGARDADRTVPGDFIRRLMASMPFALRDHRAIADREPGYLPFQPAAEFAPVAVSAAGVRIRGAIVDGLVDLSDCTGPGGQLPPLALEQCRLLGRKDVSESDLENDRALLCLDLSRASIACVSLKESAFTQVQMFNARIDGTVDISGVGPLAGWKERDVGAERMTAFRDAMQAAARDLRDDRESRNFSELLPPATLADYAPAKPPAMAHPHDYCWIDLSDSQIEGTILAQGARLRVPRGTSERRPFALQSPRFALRLEAAVIAGSLDSRGGSVFDGGLSLYLAEIRDEVWLGGARLLKEDGIALDAQGARLGGIFALADPPLRILGTAFLNSCRITGHFKLRKADIDGDGNSAVVMASATIGGDMTLHEGVAVRGPVDLTSTRIGGVLDLSGAMVSGGVRAEPDRRIEIEWCNAIDARNLSVGSDAFLADGFIAHGCVNLSGSQVGDNFDLRGATLAGTIPNPYFESQDAAFSVVETRVSALSCSDMAVGRSLRLGGNRSDARMFVAQGTVSFQRASIGKDLDIINARITNARPPAADDDPTLDLGWTSVANTLIVSSNEVSGEMSLEHASAKILCDDESGYGGASHVRLNGLTFEAFFEPPGDDEDSKQSELVEERRAWLKRMPPHYWPQPYANLAQVWIKHGRPDEAREILIEKYKRENKERTRRLRWRLLADHPFRFLRIAGLSMASSLWGLMFGYGLKPSRAMSSLVVAIVLGSLFFFLANARHAMVIDQQPIAGYVVGERMGALLTSDPVDGGVWCGDRIDSLLYALDVFIPLVDLRQESRCEVDKASGDHSLFVFIIGGVAVLAEVEIYRYLKALYALFGWLLISLSILTFSGVLQRRDLED